MAAGYPRPQLVRDDFTSLDGPWSFALGAAGPYSRTIEVPFPPESPASGIHEDVSGPLWYRREFEHEPRAGHRLLLHFEGVDHDASVWVNGVHVGDHAGSQSGFSFDITEAVQAGGNELVVRAIDSLDLEQPRGKQDWLPEPHVIWYRRTSGIWRSVWLEQVPETRIERLTLIPNADLASIQLEADIAGAPVSGLELEVELRVRGAVLVRSSFDGSSGIVRTSLGVDVPEDLWWTPESPTLIDVTARLVRGDIVLDTTASYLGLRTVGTDSTSVLLNGRPYFLRLVLEQGYWPQSHLASPSFEALEREAALIKELGFNGLRMHQTSADPRFLAICDRIGLVVLADAAAAYEFSDVALSRTVAEVTGLVERDLGHPCVIGWVPFNESWGVPQLPTSPEQREAVRALSDLVKTLDPSRLVTGNDGWEFVAGDFVGVHDYAQQPAVLRERYGSAEAVRHTLATEQPGDRVLVLPGGEDRAAAIPVILSEFGGLSVHDVDDAWDAYGDVLTPDELVARLAAMVAAIGEDSGLAGYCYTQLTDTEQEMNGLLTERRVPKAPPENIRAALLGGRTPSQSKDRERTIQP
jgi:beta-galactosidase/beta-glucuronidase